MSIAIQNRVFVVMSCVLSSFYAVAGGFFLAVALPEEPEPRLRDEFYTFDVTFTNRSGAGVHVFADVRQMLSRRQMGFAFETGVPVAEPDMFRAPQDWWSVTNRASMAEVADGGAFTWTVTGYEIAAVCARYGASNVMCRVMLGENVWVDSRKVPVAVLDEGLDEAGVLVFEGGYRSRGGGTAKVQVYRAEIGGQFYLFTGACVRLCRVLPDEVPVFRVDSGAAVLTVEAASLSRPVRYHMNEVRIVH